jgi:hypothetical protein
VTNSADASAIVGALVGTSPATPTTLSDPAGNFSIPNVPIPTNPTSYTVTASKGGFASGSAIASLSMGAPTATVNIVLTPVVGPPPTQGDLNVLVTNRDGEPQSGVDVDVAGAVVASGTTDANGFVIFTGLNEGAYTVSASTTISGVDFRASGGTNIVGGATAFLPLTLMPDIDQSELDSVADTTRPMTKEFYQQLGQWVLVPSGKAVSTGRFQIVVFDSLGGETTIQAGPNEELTVASDGLHYGRMRYLGQTIESFEARDVATGSLLWPPHDARGYYYYRIAPGGKTTIGKRWEGPPDTSFGGSLVTYDENGDKRSPPPERGEVECRTPSAARFSRNGRVTLVRCRDGLKAIDATGAVVGSLEGLYGNFVPSNQGSFVAVPVRKPNILRIIRVSSPPLLPIDLSSPITETAITPEDDLVVAAAGNKIVFIDLATGIDKWPRHTIQGQSPKVVSMSVASDGFVAVGILLESNREDGGVYPAAVELLRNGMLLSRQEFEVYDPGASIPDVSLNSEIQRLLVYDQTKVWYIRLRRLNPVILPFSSPFLFVSD